MNTPTIMTSPEMTLFEQAKDALHDITRGRLEISEGFFNTQIAYLEKEGQTITVESIVNTVLDIFGNLLGVGRRL